MWKWFLRFPSRLCERCGNVVLEFPHFLHQTAANASACTMLFSSYLSAVRPGSELFLLQADKSPGRRSGPEFHRCQVVEAAVRSFAIIKVPIPFDQDFGFGTGTKHIHIKAFITQLSVKAFPQSILPGASRIDVNCLAASRSTSRCH